MEMTEQGLAVVRSFEGRALRAYKDSVGVWTIGYGNTNYDAFAVAHLGRKIGAGLTITEQQAEYLLRESLSRNYMPAVTKAMGEASPQAGDAGGSFHYNTGGIGRASWVKLWKTGAGASAITASLGSWNKAGGKVLAGLVRRRAREAAILLRGDYGPEGKTKPPAIDANGRVVGVAETGHALAGTPGMLKLDDKGPSVSDLNASLALLGYKTKGEVFTMVTDGAVRAVQKAHPQLTVDGIAGPATRAVINREADLKRKAVVVAGTSGSVASAGGAVEVLTTSGIPGSIWIAGAVLVAVAFAWVAWRYSDEIIAFTKRD